MGKTSWTNSIHLMRVLSEPLLGEDGDVVRAVQQGVHLNNGSSWSDPGFGSSEASDPN